MPYVIGEPCIDFMDSSCTEVCPVDCIYQGERKLYINPGECIDCGACEPACPVDAITPAASVPSGQEVFVTDNARFFNEPLPGRDMAIGEPGGAADFGPVGVDTQLVAGYRSAERA